ncbi:MHYT domain-containing protein [Nocardia arizonensis]|uniref:MHYT domain-containing protein n=1 Tax=Nocardia arizonensis TaxID=1141647 RepID=UPI0006D12040|nr:MHYT domain-containing protein [Nocardia arizonensis]
MLEIHHFSYGWLTPALAYIMSFVGSLLGLQCAARARSGGNRLLWPALAALAIGGTGIWVMHFIAMLGFSIDTAQIRYDVPVTLLSAVAAVVVVGIGLAAVLAPRPHPLSLVAGGTITGLGVAGMHYVGMYAMKSDAAIGYDMRFVALSLVVAVVAATAALWFTVHVRGMVAAVGAALIMAVAVCGMHYTGMAGMHAHPGGHGVPPGTEAVHLLAPLIVGSSLVTMVLLIAVSLTSIEHDMDLPPVRPATVRPVADDIAPPPKVPQPKAVAPQPDSRERPGRGPVDAAEGPPTAYWPATRQVPRRR